MKAKQLRVIIPIAVMVLIAIGYATQIGIGTISAFGWGDISLLCPLGALFTMLASKTLIPRAVISLVIVIVLIILLARAFCAWICPVPIVSKIRGLFGGESSNMDLRGCGVVEPADNPLVDASKGEAKEVVKAEAELTEDEKAALKGCSDKSKCSSCADMRAKLDSRHFILGGSLLSAFIFGFPVFCLVCPIGLSFATILLVMRLFSFGDVSWSVVVIPLLLLVEVVFFRKWCSKICPISAFMSLIGKANKTFRPTINDDVCIESSHHRSCEICASVCPEGINPRHPEAGTAWSECTKCRACVDNCPTKAISMPFIPKAGGNASTPEVVVTAATSEE